MPTTITKEGPYFSSGEIRLSSLRTYFRETSTGALSMSELRRDTNVLNPNPIVPDSTENENISTGSNLAFSQFRNSVKRYYATQTGFDDNASFPNEAGFRMGLYDGLNDMKGLDWSGLGHFGPDGRGGVFQTGLRSNASRNIQKIVNINGVCVSRFTQSPAAAMGILTPAYNYTINIAGQLYGKGGDGGFDGRGFPYGNASGLNGGNALNVTYPEGTTAVINIAPTARIYGGGGGGEQGRNGATGTNGTCLAKITVTGCGRIPTQCPSGYAEIGRTITSNCCEYYPPSRLGLSACFRRTNIVNCEGGGTPSSFPAGALGGILGQGIGGRGGNGEGYNSPPTRGQAGARGLCPVCPSGTTLSGGSCGLDGYRGGDGGSWGRDGQETDGRASAGRAGAAIGGITEYPVVNYTLNGTVDSTTIKGTIYERSRGAQSF